jgi:hypothetical protein
MKAISLLLASLVFCCFFSVPARADEILLGTPPLQNGVGGGGFVKISVAQAEGFFLTQPITLTGINIGILSDTGYNSDRFLFQLADLIGPSSTTADILASLPVSRSRIPVSPCNPPGCPYLSLSLPPLTLSPGEYFLVGAEVFVSDVTASGALWGGALSTLPSTVGGIGPSFQAAGSGVNVSNPASSNWSPYTDNRILNFQLLGTVNKVPEPSSLLLLGTGVLALLAVGLRKKTAYRFLARRASHLSL